MSTLRKLLALFRRDVAITRSYRSAFAFEILEALFVVASFYYLSRFIASDELRQSLPQGPDYFAYALVGLAFFDYLTVSVLSFERSLQEARESGTLETLLVSQTSLPTILAGSSLYHFVLTALRTLVYLAWAILVFDFPATRANWVAIVVVIALSVLASAGLGILSASYILLFKRGNPLKWALLGISGLAGGVFFPASVLPEALQWVARLIPVSYSLSALRAALLEGASLTALWSDLGALLLFAVVLLPLSFLAFAWTLRRTKIVGSLTHQ